MTDADRRDESPAPRDGRTSGPAGTQLYTAIRRLTLYGYTALYRYTAALYNTTPLGLQLVNESDEITASAWVFVGLNVVVFLYAAYTLLLAPLANSASLLTGG